MSDDKCERCDGCGKVWGEGTNEVPAKVMYELPFQNAAPGLMLCPPRECPRCKGTGRAEKDGD